MPAALRIRLRPPSHPTRYSARSEVSPDSSDVDAGVVLVEARHIAFTEDGDAELIHPAGQDGLDAALPQRKEVVVAGGEVADVQGRPGVAHERMHLALGEEPVGDAALVEHLDGAGVETPGSRSVDILIRASLDDDDVDPCQCQLARQHQSGRTPAPDHDRMVGRPSLRTVGTCHVATAYRSCRPPAGRSWRALSGHRGACGCPALSEAPSRAAPPY